MDFCYIWIMLVFWYSNVFIDLVIYLMFAPKNMQSLTRLNDSRVVACFMLLVL